MDHHSSNLCFSRVTCNFHWVSVTCNHSIGPQTRKLAALFPPLSLSWHILLISKCQLFSVFLGPIPLSRSLWPLPQSRSSSSLTWTIGSFPQTNSFQSSPPLPDRQSYLNTNTGQQALPQAFQGFLIIFQWCPSSLKQQARPCMAGELDHFSFRLFSLQSPFPKTHVFLFLHLVSSCHPLRFSWSVSPPGNHP